MTRTGGAHDRNLFKERWRNGFTDEKRKAAIAWNENWRKEVGGSWEQYEDIEGTSQEIYESEMVKKFQRGLSPTRCKYCILNEDEHFEATEVGDVASGCKNGNCKKTK